MENEKLLEKLNSLFKEELWGRIEPKDIGISKFKILDDLFNNLIGQGLFNETQDVCRSHIADHPDSITASYIVGLIGYHLDRLEDKVHLRKLIELFLDHHKWAVVQRIAERVLEYGENRVALKALATGLEKLGRNKEAIPIWENLLRIDRFDAEVSKKLAFAIIEDDPEKSIQFMKLSIEGFIKNGQYDEISELWNKLVSVSWSDIQFFERIERMLVDAKQRDLAATLLKSLLHKYRDEENPGQSIDIIKKILDYLPEDSSARRELIRFYEKKYGTHSQYQQFLKISRLGNFKIPVRHAIQDFEKNIVFDKGNYAYHRSWGIGNINEIDSEYLVINFRDKSDHRMSIPMALQSLTPIKQDHLFVVEFEDPEALRLMFKEDFLQFFEILIKSFNNEISVTEIKKLLIPKYVEQKNWSKWWSKARTDIKKDPRFGTSEKKKDHIFMREKPVTYADELLDRFTNAPNFSGRTDLALEFVNNVEAAESPEIAQYFIDYYTKQVKEGSPTKQILSYFILRGFSKFVDAKKLKLDAVRAKLVEYIKESQEIPLLSIKITSYDYKKDLVNIIMESREDWTHVVSEILFETPVRIHKYIMNNLIQNHAYNVINSFIDRVITGAKQYPEIFLWVARSLMSRVWDYEWLDYPREALLLTYFRLMNELKKIEAKGNRMKNMAVDILFDNEAAVLKEIVATMPQSFVGKVYDMLAGVSYIEESQRDRFFAIIRTRFPEFSVKTAVQARETEEWKFDVEKILVSREGYARITQELNHMINSEMPTLTKELAGVSDVSGDIRENVEYNTLMEKQTILKMAINKLENEIKKAEILDLEMVSTESVNVGTNIVVEEVATGEKNTYTLLGPWDADYEKRILSYRSPIGMVLLGRKPGEVVDLKLGEEVRALRIVAIEKYVP
ncbi:MAG: transcription elongation factor GreA [Spirochaetes bacterium]|nr:MAG: transcription elongation factor GreA [Spirochaetota bacterium]